MMGQHGRSMLGIIRLCQAEFAIGPFSRRASSLAAKLPLPRVTKSSIPNVGAVFVIASGKGGVGKSTVAVNLAVSFAHKCGLSVGLLDADIFGPSVPNMMGLTGMRPQTTAQGHLIPLENHGVKCMSIGSLVDIDKAIVWRGPMVGKAMEQMIFGCVWGHLDILVVDLPPGTGDTHITLAQRVNVDGAALVTTPQEVALADVRRSLAMLRTVDIPILGVLENMSYHVCASCGVESAIFGAGGGARLAKESGLPLLGRLPLDTRVMEGGEVGAPVVLTYGESAIAHAYEEAAKAFVEALVARGHTMARDCKVGSRL